MRMEIRLRKILNQAILMKDFKSQWQTYSDTIESYLSDHLAALTVSQNPAVKNLISSMEYSTLGGGKRFRPVLSLATAEILNVPTVHVLPYAAAVEFIHTYSLIHDDLPCMDDDDVRRNRPTNHKVYGDAVALLAGDALLTEAFKVVSLSEAEPLNILHAIQYLSQNCGVHGMVGGQAMDLFPKERELELNEILEIHRGKTGALISAAVLGPAILSRVDQKVFEQLKKYAENLGLAFQIKDDILDDGVDDPNNFVHFMGREKTIKYLETLTENCHSSLASYGSRAGFLKEVASYNFNRNE